MYLEVEAGPNTGESVSAIYRDVTAPREVFCVKYHTGGAERPMQVTGWDAETQSPCPAHACRIEESGDGVALLIYGGSGGIRLKELEDESEWSLDAPGQWGATHLIYPRGSFIVYKDEI